MCVYAYVFMCAMCMCMCVWHLCDWRRAVGPEVVGLSLVYRSKEIQSRFTISMVFSFLVSIGFALNANPEMPI